VTYYTAANECLDDLRPMTKEESIEAYRGLIKEEPQALADLYIDFHDFIRIEFLVFKDRLSSAVLIRNSARQGIGELATKLETIQQDGSYIVPGWEAESGEVHHESVFIVRDARKISIGATIVTAVAALESLLVDLLPESKSRRRGLHALLQDFLRLHVVPEPARTEITAMGNTVRDRRNAFAHSLTGSFWKSDTSIAGMFTLESLEDTLHTVGRIAVLMEEIVLA
jgi:hypothetical protein